MAPPWIGLWYPIQPAGTLYWVKVAVTKSGPQLIPVEVTVPLPAPAFTTVTTARARKFGVTVVLALRTKAHVALVAPPAQVTPVQLTKV
jgi:hypothetical protein